MAANQLTTQQREKWRALYRAGWRLKRTPGRGWWRVVDERGQLRSNSYPNRDHAVAEVIEK